MRLIYMSVHDDLQIFLFKYGVIGNAISVIVALMITNLIASLMGDLIVPCMNYFLFHVRLKHYSKYLPGNEKINMFQLTKTIVTFVFTAIFLYTGFIYLIHPFMNRSTNFQYASKLPL